MGMIDKIQFVPSTNQTLGAAIATTDSRSSIVDMQGAEGVVFAWQQSSGGTSGGATAFRVMGSTGNSTGGMKPLGGSTGTVITMSSGAFAGITMDNKFIGIDVVKPVNKRYVQLVIDNCTAGQSLFAFKYADGGIRRQGSSDVAQGSTLILATTSIIGAATS